MIAMFLHNLTFPSSPFLYNTQTFVFALLFSAVLIKRDSSCNYSDNNIQNNSCQIITEWLAISDAHWIEAITRIATLVLGYVKRTSYEWKIVIVE